MRLEVVGDIVGEMNCASKDMVKIGDFCYNVAMDLILLQKIGVAVALGALVGLEREQKSQRIGLAQFGGIRTLTLISLLGALSYFLSTTSMVFFALLAGGFLALLVVSYVLTSKKYKDVGATSEMAAMLVFVIGILSAMGEFVVATLVTLTVIAVLHFKEVLHQWAKHLENEELLSTLQFVAVAFVVLPLLPDAEYGPYGFFNPRTIWLMVVLVSGLSYVSYLAIKFFGGKKGIGLMGFLAGFVSSTALAVNFSEHSKHNRKVVTPYVLATVMAGSAVFFRVFVEVAAVSPQFLPQLYVPMLSMGVTGVLVVLYLWWRGDGDSKGVEKKVQDLQSPFSLVPALKFGLLFAASLFFTRFGREVAGDCGVYLTSFLAGFVDVDAVTLSIANDVNNGFSAETGMWAVTIVTMVNTMVKAGIFFVFGNRVVAKRVFVSFSLIVLVGLAALTFA